MNLSENEFSLLESRAELLKTMGHPVRLAILSLLVAKEKMTVTDIFSKLEIEQSTASHHLRLMRSAGIVDLTKSGKHSFYYVANDVILKIFDSISTVE